MSRMFKVRLLQEGGGAVAEEVFEATSALELRRSLLSNGRTPLSIHRIVRLHWPWRRPQKPAFALFCREMRTLIQAGMTVVEAVDTLSAKERLSGQNTSVAAQVLQQLEQGKALSQALQHLPGVPSVLVAAVRAGERTSDLSAALDDYLRFDTLITQLRRKVVSAAIYPALVTTLGLGISVFLLLVVMPNFARMYEQMRGEAAGPVGWMIGLSLWVREHQAMAVLGVLLLGLGMAAWVVSGKAGVQLMAWVQRWSWVRRRVEDFHLAMMYQALTLMLKGGYPMTDALRVASRSAMDQRLTLSLERALAQIEQGRAVAQSLFSEKLCDEVGRRLMAAAERNGDFHLAADVVSRMHGERFELFVERVTRIAEPVLLMAVALLVGGIVVMMYLPVFDMATRLR
jgi:general secretion pathway protein F